jgi:cysteinyl-tRNA synthetase
MNDDFNTPRGIAALFDLSREVNSLLNSDEKVTHSTLERIDDLYQVLGSDVLGLLFDDQSRSSTTGTGDELVLDGLVRMLIDIRKEARQARDWARADSIRDQLADIGITLEDGAEGTRWRLNR